MCGFAGIVRFDGTTPDEARLRAMSDHLAHRGPDGEGMTLAGSCGMVHRRLAIIDLLSGQQPMTLAPGDDAGEGTGPWGSTISAAGVAARCGPLTLVFNGEIYNHRQLRRKLERRGYDFRSDHSDTEALLYGYRAFGDQLPKHLHGMFAFAVYDADQRRLFLCRDRVGKKPLYVRRDPDGRGLAFASLPATLDAGRTEREPAAVNRASLHTYLTLGYTFEDTLAPGVRELAPATSLTLTADGHADETVYWRPPPISKHSTALGAADALEEVLGEAVSARLEADVPLGCFLSGGIDSSLVAALAHKRLKQLGGGPLRTFSVAMPDTAYDETVYAQAVADHLGTEHTVLDTHADHAADDLEFLMAQGGEPSADSSLLPTHWLCRAARQHFRAALSGDGGDELFGGYDRYRGMTLLSRHRWWVRSLPITDGPPRSLRSRLGRLVQAARAGADGPAAQYRSMIHLFSEDQIDELYPGLALPDGAPALHNFPQWPDRAHAAMRWDLQHYLPHVMLRKVDRASMAVALEVRSPLLDTAVCDLAGHLPTAVLMPGGRPKGLLRQVAARHLPDPIVRRPKAGFAIPLDTWLRTTLKDALHARLTDGRLQALGLQQAPIDRLFDEHQNHVRDHHHRLFALHQLSLWAAQRGG